MLMDEFPSDAERAQRADSTAELAAQITELAGHLNAATYRFLKLIAEFDRRQGWADNATQSCAHWLNWQCGIDMGAAREKVRTAHALESLPKLSAAMERGELSYAKVRAVTRVACPATEDILLSTAIYGTAQHVERLVRHYRRAKDAEELSREAQQQVNRFLSYHWDDDGSLVFKGRMPAEAGALLVKALDVALEEVPILSVPVPNEPTDVSAETPNVKSPAAARRIDALGLVAESFLRHGLEAMKGGDKHQIVIHVDADTLRHSTAGRCEIEHGPSMAAETVRRLACDASIVSVIWPAASGHSAAGPSQGDPLNVGRKTRSIPPALQRALNARDQGCRFPGCCNKRFTDAHHIHHWAHGGETKLSNLLTLCRFHHRQVHEGNVLIHTLDDGAIRFLKPNGTSFDSVAPNHTHPIGDWTQLPAVHQQQGIHIDSHTAATRWRGESMDYGLAVECLLQRARRAKDVSAATSE
jgi:hypothetical protein